MAQAGRDGVGDRSRSIPRDPTTRSAAVGTHPDARAPGYEDAVAHYLSPSRRDPVKRLWEEPVNHRVIATALDALEALDAREPDPTRPLTVVDIGAGTGDGIELFTGSLELARRPDRGWRYIGIDPDPAMIDAARTVHRDRANVSFLRGDVREPLPVTGADLYLSAGVPWSHLTHPEFTDALTQLFATIDRDRHPAAVVLDVLGRYSLEWIPRWSMTHWDYAMSFFEGAGDEHIAAPMSFHSRPSLEQAISAAQRRSGVAIGAVEYRDRSVMVGRHTATGTFNPRLPPYRTLINALYEGDPAVNLDDLRLDPPDHSGAAPAEITTFFSDLRARWNSRLGRARVTEARTGPTPAGRAALAADLCACEHSTQRGLGAGHTLIALLLVSPL